jgi:dTDP-4-amino-4,6-dideoxygalactose transaminase
MNVDTKPYIPIRPSLSWFEFKLHKNHSIPSILDVGTTLAVTSGRVAIALALRHMGISRGNKVLVPAYHCIAMIEPITWAGATPAFYRIHEDTSVDLDDVQRKLDVDTRALLVTHYYGFPQDMTRIRAFCNAHKLVLIEDCAHAFFGRYAGQPLGTFGDYAVASAMKFFPAYDGGYLVSPRLHVGEISLRSPGWLFEAKAISNTLEYSLGYERLPGARLFLRSILSLKDRLWRRRKSRRKNNQDNLVAFSVSENAYAFDPRWLDKRMSICSGLIIRLSSKAKIIERRRNNYETLLKALSGMPHSKPLFPYLNDGVVPYLFPLLVDEPDRVFPSLRATGVPVLRFGEDLWKGYDMATCPVTGHYSHHLLQFPTHQSLRPKEINWMISRIEEALMQS